MRKETNAGHKDIYSSSPFGCFLSPFSLSIDRMEKLILVNFEKDPDKYYNTFELQQANDISGRKRFLVIAYRKDGAADIYYQSDYPFCSQTSILNDVSLFVCPLEDAEFEIIADKLQVCFSFKDRFGRQIKVVVHERHRSKKKPFFLLAPVGVVAKQPTSFPVYSLYAMSFTIRKHTEIEIKIDNIKHKPDSFPLPVECAGNFFTRYSGDTFNVDWNKNYQGPLKSIVPDQENKAADNGTNYELINNGGHFEIKRIGTKNGKHELTIEFSPPVPDILCLKNDLKLGGTFKVKTDNTNSHICGEYMLHRHENDVSIELQPNQGWQPNEKRLILSLLFMIVKVFREWPKSYTWRATINLENITQPEMKSGWERKT
jgi:hypothetical protein